MCRSDTYCGSLILIIILNVAWRREGWRDGLMRTVIATLTISWLTPSRSTLAVRKLCLYGVSHWHFIYHLTWYTSSRCVVLFYVPAPVYVVVSACLIRVCGATVRDTTVGCVPCVYLTYRPPCGSAFVPTTYIDLTNQSTSRITILIQSLYKQA